MTGSQPTAEVSTPLTQDFVEPDQNVVGGVSDNDSDAGSPERTLLGEEEAAEEVDAEEVEEDDEVQEPALERLAPVLPLIEISTELRAQETAFASDDLNDTSYAAHEEGQEDAVEEYLATQADSSEDEGPADEFQFSLL